MATISKCHAKGCGAEAFVKGFMCRRHWQLIPFDLQEVLISVPKNLDDCSKDQFNAIDRAIDVVFIKEFRSNRGVRISVIR